MKLIDTNGISYLLGQNLESLNECFMAPDVKDEVQMTQLIYARGTPDNISGLDEHYDFDRSIYLKHYKEMLNKHGGRSFFNMTGFGDISILASVHMLLEIYRNRGTQQLFDLSERIVIYSNDQGLKKRVGMEFDEENVSALSIDSLELEEKS